MMTALAFGALLGLSCRLAPGPLLAPVLEIAKKIGIVRLASAILRLKPIARRISV